MAASDSSPSSPSAPPGFEWPGAPELDERLREEIGRAERHQTALSCLLIVVENLDEMAGEHGEELREQTLAYIAGALRRELRRFDRVGMPSASEVLVVLPGADGPRGEVVARRVLDRLRAIKVEVKGERQGLRISVGLSAWRADATPAMLLSRARAAAARSDATGVEPQPGDAPAPEPPAPSS
jgi:diguanylate cyclase (GGDEF)-like protein